MMVKAILAFATLVGLAISKSILMEVESDGSTRVKNSGGIVRRHLMAEHQIDQSVTTPTAEAATLAQSQPVHGVTVNPTSNGKKCGDSHRIFSLEGVAATKNACIQACESKLACAAFSGVFDVKTAWCIGCNISLSVSEDGAIAYNVQAAGNCDKDTTCVDGEVCYSRTAKPNVTICSKRDKEAWMEKAGYQAIEATAKDCEAVGKTCSKQKPHCLKITYQKCSGDNRVCSSMCMTTCPTRFTTCSEITSASSQQFFEEDLAKEEEDEEEDEEDEEDDEKDFT